MKSLMKVQESLAEHKPKRFIFWTENQPGDNLADPCRLQLSFTEIVVSPPTGQVCLRNNDKNSIYFVGVEDAWYDKDASPLGDVITLLCTVDGQEMPQVYRIIAQ